LYEKKEAGRRQQPPSPRTAKSGESAQCAGSGRARFGPQDLAHEIRAAIAVEDEGKKDGLETRQIGRQFDCRDTTKAIAATADMIGFRMMMRRAAMMMPKLRGTRLLRLCAEMQLGMRVAADQGQRQQQNKASQGEATHGF
jgi:hypothetical protein